LAGESEGDDFRRDHAGKRERIRNEIVREGSERMSEREREREREREGGGREGS